MHRIVQAPADLVQVRSKARGGVGTHDRRNRSAAGPFQGPSCPIASATPVSRVGFQIWCAAAAVSCAALGAVATAGDDERGSAHARTAGGGAYINTVAPAFGNIKDPKIKLKRRGTPAALKKAWEYEAKHAGGNPEAAHAACGGRAAGAAHRREPERVQAGADDADGEAAHDPRRVQPGRGGRLQRLDGAQDGLRRPHLRPGRHAERPAAQHDLGSREQGLPRQQHLLGTGLQPRALRRDALLQHRHHPARAEGPPRP